MSHIRLLVVIGLTLLASSLSAQKTKPVTIVDENGVMRQSKDKSEIHGFGVNYTLPFAHEYRVAVKAGVNVEEAIQQDVYHMARLDLDLYRVHVWDTEISDTVGNLIDNVHLKLFDFTISEMKKRGMRFVITPIAFWGNGWPENDEKTPGFSYKYGKDACLTNPDAIAAQAKYLNQFLQHVNPYTGIAYKDEPNILAFEISNEPHHGGTPQSVTDYINTMVKSMRQTGTQTPIFYNISHNTYLGDAYFDADIQGGTFQWYPTNLVANHQINGNFLPHVQEYTTPYANNPKFKKLAKIVYEFDPADVGTNIMYPAMALSFRKAGFQLATEFAYDAMVSAPVNTNYGTHFMNLAYAPHKAISLKIASAVFHNQPMGNIKPIDALHISYENNLAEWLTTEKFFYSNNTQTLPVYAAKLKEIAGCGSSPVIQYNGTGAYFLDKIADGVWRLEVMPEAYWIDDPYSKASPEKQKAAVQSSLRQISINLPNLGNQFVAKPINRDNQFKPVVNQGGFDIKPGVYLLKNPNIKQGSSIAQNYKNINISEFVAPSNNLNKTAIWNHTPAEVIEGKAGKITFDVATPGDIKKVTVVLTLNEKWETLTAKAINANSYEVEIPAKMQETGFLNYRIMVETSVNTTTFPAGDTLDPWRWDNTNNPTYALRIVPEQTPLLIWDAAADWENSLKTWNRDVNLVPTAANSTALSIKMNELPMANEVLSTERSYAYKFWFGDKIASRANELNKAQFIVIQILNQNTDSQPIEIGLIDKNATVVAAKLTINNNQQIYKIPINQLTNAEFIVVPRPFPDFLPYRVKTNTQPFDINKAETLQVEVKPGASSNVNLNIEKIWFE